MIRRAALCAPEARALFREHVTRALCVPEPSAPQWNFYDGVRETWHGPSGTRICYCELTSYGRTGLSVQGPDEEEVSAIFSQLVGALAHRDWISIEAGWRSATDARETLQALLDCIAWLSLLDEPPDELPLVEIWSKALDHAHPVIRLLAMRTLWVLPASLRAQQLEGREDEDNPALSAWLEHYRAQDPG